MMGYTFYEIAECFAKAKKLKKEREEKEQESLKINTGFEHIEIYNELKEEYSNLGNSKDFWNKFYNKSNIILISGMRGAGKTALAFRLAENMRHINPERQIYAMGFDQKLPNWVHHSDNIKKVPIGSLVLWDEAGISLNQHSTFNTLTRDTNKLLLIARHRKLSLIFISQNMANLSIGVVRMGDTYLLLKDSLVQQYTDRSFIKKIYQELRESDRGFDYKKNGQVYIFDDLYKGMTTFSLPSFWSDDISEAYKNLK